MSIQIKSWSEHEFCVLITSTHQAHI